MSATHPGDPVPPFPWAPELPQLLPWGPEATALMGPVVGWKTDSGAGWATWRERREEASKLEFPFPSSLKGAGLKGGRWEPSSRAAWISEDRAVPRSRGGAHAAQDAPQRDGVTRRTTPAYLLPRQCRPRSRGFLEAILRRLIFTFSLLISFLFSFTFW